MASKQEMAPTEAREGGANVNKVKRRDPCMVAHAQAVGELGGDQDSIDGLGEPRDGRG
jgi:hypothetical protein